jgi:hypothetical protein
MTDRGEGPGTEKLRASAKTFSTLWLLARLPCRFARSGTSAFTHQLVR